MSDRTIKCPKCYGKMFYSSSHGQKACETCQQRGFVTKDQNDKYKSDLEAVISRVQEKGADNVER